MKGLSITFSILLVLVALPALADRPVAAELGSEGGIISPGELTATPEMWFYQQYQREYQDPNMAVRKKAEFRASQRQRRMAALKWFGFSNQRPHYGCDPIHGDWSPRWTSNNGFYPYQWNGVGWPWMIVKTGSSAGRTD